MRLYTSHHPAQPLVLALFTSFVRFYVRPDVRGCENLPAEGPFILAANHNSHADTAVLFTVLPRHLRHRVVAAAAQDYFFDGGVRQHTARILFNAIPVMRSRFGSTDPLRHVARALREGYGVLMFPEGTRSRDNTLGTFRNGIGRLIAYAPPLPVIPTWIDGTARVLPKGQLLPRPFPVSVTFGAPLYLDASPDDRASWQTSATAVREALLRLGGQG